MAAGEEFIRIQNNLVSIVSEQVVRQMPLDQFAGMIGTKEAVTLPVLGRTQRFVHYDPTNSNDEKLFALTEIPAGRRAISKNLRDGTARRYTLALPYTFLWFVCTSQNQGASWDVTDYRIFFSRTSFEGVDTPMIPALLPNVYRDGRICWGSTGTSPRQSLANRLDTLTNEWYISRFNADLDGEGMIPQGESNYGRWVRESAENPSCWQSWDDWATRPAYTVTRLLSEHGVEPRPVAITLADSVPEIPIRPTFGAWEEWIMQPQIPEIERARLSIAFDNLRAENPHAFDINMFETVEPTRATATPVDDGGVVIDYVR